VPDYRTCVRGENGAILRSYSFSVADDQGAIERSGSVEGAIVEVWQGERLVKRLEQSFTVKSFPARRRF
jgi:hypothetical protein